MDSEPKTIELLFEVEKDTKNTRRFAEQACRLAGKDTPAPAVNTLYVQKWALKALNDGDMPNTLKVVITKVD